MTQPPPLNGDTTASPNHPPVVEAREKVVVFWDYENCPCPMSSKLATLTYDIKQRIDYYLGKKVNKRIQLYCPMQRLQPKVRENATDLGIVMTDVASKRKQESVDKRIIADIGLFATDLAECNNREIGHIVLVSGDSDYGYILARLRDKSYIGQIIIFINDYTKETLTQHADHVHVLFSSNLSRKDNPFSDFNQRKIPSYPSIQSSMHYSPYHTAHTNGSHAHNQQQNFRLNGSSSKHANHTSTMPIYSQQWPRTQQQTAYPTPTSNVYNTHRSKSESRLHKSHNKQQHQNKQQRAHIQSPGQVPIQVPIKHILSKPNPPSKQPPPIPSTNATPNKPNTYRRKEHQTSNKQASDAINKSPSSSPQRVVSQENLEQQLKQQQRSKKASTSKKPSSKAKSLKTTSSKPISQTTKPSKGGSEPLRPVAKKLTSKTTSSNNKKMELDSDFFASMIAPNESDMEALLADMSAFDTDVSTPLKMPPRRANVSHVVVSPPMRADVTSVSAVKKASEQRLQREKRERSIRFVWDALEAAQKEGNRSPRREELYEKMTEMFPGEGEVKDTAFAQECVAISLAHGAVEEMIRGRIQALYMLPLVLNAVTGEGTTLVGNGGRGEHVWISLDELIVYLRKRHDDSFESYFTRVYVWRVIASATKLFSWNKEDRVGASEVETMDGTVLGKVRFRARRAAMGGARNGNGF